jgi:hypothetical protein
MRTQPPQQQQPAARPPAEEVGGAIQMVPEGLPSRATAPILPPLASPQGPSWKQELKPPVEKPEGGEKPNE